MDGDPIRILPQEVVEAVQQLSVHKSHPAGDVFSLLFKKYITTGGATRVCEEYNTMISTDALPEDWEFTRAVLVHKGGEKNKNMFRIIVVD
eukprot:5060667-Heterocapsa_arctica.AAC.1